MNDSHSTSALIDRFLESFNSGDLGAMRRALADDAVAFVTGPDGNPVRLDSADMYIAALGAMDLTNVDYSVELTQAPMLVGDVCSWKHCACRTPRGLQQRWRVTFKEPRSASIGCFARLLQHEQVRDVG